MKKPIPYLLLVKRLRHYPEHALPLAKNHNLFITITYHLINDMHRFSNLGVMTAPLIKHKRTVAYHPHYRKAHQKFLAVFLAQEHRPAPFLDQASHRKLIFRMNLHLLFRHRDEKGFVGAWRHLESDILFPAPYKIRSQALRDMIEVAVANHTTRGISFGSICNKLIIRSKCILVHQLHH